VQVRYFVLCGTFLAYWESEEEFRNGKRPIKDKVFDTTRCKVELDEDVKYLSEGKFAFFVEQQARTGEPVMLLHLRAASFDERDEWINALRTFV
jgi:hypothetical protein